MRRRALAVCLLLGLLATAAAQSTNSKVQPAQQGGSAPKPGASGSSSSSLDSSSNPLLSTSLFPKWDKIKASDVGPAVDQILFEEGASLDLLEADLARAGKDVTYERIFRPYTQIRYRLDVVYGQFDHLQGVMDSPALRKAVENVQPRRVAFELRFSQSKPIYDAVMALRSNEAAYQALSPEQRRVVDITIKDFKTSGVGLDPVKKKQYNELVDKQSKLSTKFTNNVLDSTAAFKLFVTDKKQVEGLEPTTLAVAAQKAAEAGRKGATADAGPWLLTLDYTTYSAVVSFAKDRELRRQMYLAYRAISSQGPTDNTDVINQLLAGRQQLAAILGFPNYADMSFLGRMATLKQANALMDELTLSARPTAVREDAELRAYARNVTRDPSLDLLWWDNAFWAERRKEDVFQIKQEELRQYLPLESVKQGMFNLAKRLYGVTVRPASIKLPVWHPDVQVYEVLDTGADAPMAYLYVDLFGRPGSKQSGAWVQSLSDRAAYYREASPAARAAAALRAKGVNASGPAIFSEALAGEQKAWLAGAKKQLPVAVLISNQNPPAGGKPSLMTLDDAETLFHEFGHSLQAMLTTAKEGLCAGMRNIEWDAVETPSQMQEKWVYDRDTFNGFAKHWQTGKAVPPEVFERIKASRSYRKGNYFTYQLMLATTDLLLHSTYVPFGPLKPFDLQQQQFAKIMPFKPNPNDRQINSFSHVFTGGYSAGYYSYLWADVMSADAFMAFQEVGTSNDDAVTRLGRRFRDTFFSLGGSVRPAEVFRRFRGRDPRVEEVIKYNNLTPKA